MITRLPCIELVAAELLVGLCLCTWVVWRDRLHSESEVLAAREGEG